MSLWVFVGMAIGLAAMILLFRKDIFPKKENVNVIPHEWIQDHDRKPDIGPAHPITKKEFVSNPIYEYKLRERIDQKLRGLEKQLERNKNEPGFSLPPRDVTRYEAMIEVLKAVTQI